MRISDWISDVGSSDLRHDLAALAFEKARPEQYVDDPALILERDEDRIALARPLADQHDARGAHDRSVLRRRNLGGAQDALALEIAAQEGHRMALQRQARRLVIGKHMLDHRRRRQRSEEHTSELQSLMRISYAVFCLK